MSGSIDYIDSEGREWTHAERYQELSERLDVEREALTFCASSLGAVAQENDQLRAERDSADRGVARNAEVAVQMMRERDEWKRIAHAESDGVRCAWREKYEAASAERDRLALHGDALWREVRRAGYAVGQGHLVDAVEAWRSVRGAALAFEEESR